MDAILMNWRTSITGLFVIVLGALSTFAGIHVPGFNLDFAAALTVGVGMLLAKDSVVTGGIVKQ